MMLGYARVSTSDQAREDRTSLQEQERVIRAFAMLKGIGAYDLQIYVDAGVSGTIKLQYRPEGGKLYADAKRGDIVIASKLDRLFRDALDAQQVYADFKKRGVDLILYDMGTESVMRDGMSQFFFIMLSAFANLERQRIKERMLEGKAAKLAKGGHAGGEAPYGYRIIGSGRDAKLEMVPEEQAVIAKIAQLSEKHPRTKVVNTLEAEGVRTRTGRPFDFTQVRRILAAQHHARH